MDEAQTIGGDNEARFNDRPRPAPPQKEPETKPDAQQGKKQRKRWPLVLLGVVILTCAIGGALYAYSTRNLTNTDDAYTDGRAIMVAPQVSGYVTVLAVQDNQFVHKGDLLVQIDPRPYIATRDQKRAQLVNAKAQAASARLGAEIARKNFPARLSQAQGQLMQARGQLFQAETEYKRQHSVARPATTQQAIDQSTAQLQLAQGQVQAAQATVTQAEPVKQNIGQSEEQADQQDAAVKQAEAELATAELNLGFTHIVAAQDGWVTRRNVEMGNYLQAGTQIMSLVAPEVWITANFKETQLRRMRPGQRVEISVDAYPQLKLRGHVDSIQLGSGSKFTAFPAENATGNFIKIVQRVPVKILIDSGLDPNIPLPLGLSVEPSVHLISD